MQGCGTGLSREHNTGVQYHCFASYHPRLAPWKKKKVITVTSDDEEEDEEAVDDKEGEPPLAATRSHHKT